MEQFPVPEFQQSESENIGKSFRSQRNLQAYEFYLRMKDDDLKNKMVLDLGSGWDVAFAKDVKERLPNTKVVSLDYTFEEPSSEERNVGERDVFEGSPTGAESRGTLRARGLFTKLPFADSSFDTVLSSAAMPLYLKTEEQVRQAFTEVVRVLREKGVARISPVECGATVENGKITRIPREISGKWIESSLKGLGDAIEYQYFPGGHEDMKDPRGYPRDYPDLLVITKKKIPFWRRKDREK